MNMFVILVEAASASTFAILFEEVPISSKPLHVGIYENNSAAEIKLLPMSSHIKRMTAIKNAASCSFKNALSSGIAAGYDQIILCHSGQVMQTYQHIPEHVTIHIHTLSANTRYNCSRHFTVINSLPLHISMAEYKKIMPLQANKTKILKLMKGHIHPQYLNEYKLFRHGSAFTEADLPIEAADLVFHLGNTYMPDYVKLCYELLNEEPETAILTWPLNYVPTKCSVDAIKYLTSIPSDDSFKAKFYMIGGCSIPSYFPATLLLRPNGIKYFMYYLSGYTQVPENGEITHFIEQLISINGPTLDIIDKYINLIDIAEIPEYKWIIGQAPAPLNYKDMVAYYHKLHLKRPHVFRAGARILNVLYDILYKWSDSELTYGRPFQLLEYRRVFCALGLESMFEGWSGIEEGNSCMVYDVCTLLENAGLTCYICGDCVNTDIKSLCGECTIRACVTCYFNYMDSLKGTSFAVPKCVCGRDVKYCNHEIFALDVHEGNIIGYCATYIKKYEPNSLPNGQVLNFKCEPLTQFRQPETGDRPQCDVELKNSYTCTGCLAAMENDAEIMQNGAIREQKLIELRSIEMPSGLLFRWCPGTCAEYYSRSDALGNGNYMCAHMFCGKCRIHWCWLCRDVFSSAPKCYTHMEMMRNGNDPHHADINKVGPGSFIKPHETDAISPFN